MSTLWTGKVQHLSTFSTAHLRKFLGFLRFRQFSIFSYFARGEVISSRPHSQVNVSERHAQLSETQLTPLPPPPCSISRYFARDPATLTPVEAVRDSTAPCPTYTVSILPPMLKSQSTAMFTLFHAGDPRAYADPCL